jgi:transcriptional regulator with XRE-family HTH domain
MTSPESPAGARRRVRLVLRAARESLGLTQAHVAEEMEWSTSKVIRIESGEVSISQYDLRPLLALLGITDKAEVDRLIQDAKSARRRQAWWDEVEIRTHLTSASRQLIQYENEAVAIRHFATALVPGPLQTQAYAEAILDAFAEFTVDDEADAEAVLAAETRRRVRTESRQRRRKELLARRDFPAILLLFDESVLKRRVGSAQTTGEQLLDLLRLAEEHKKMMIRLLPHNAEGPLPPPSFGPYDILQLPGANEDAVLYRESHLIDEIEEERANVARHREMFDQYWEVSHDESTSADLIAQSAKEFLQSPPKSGTAAAGPAKRAPRRRSAS